MPGMIRTTLLQTNQLINLQYCIKETVTLYVSSEMVFLNINSKYKFVLYNRRSIQLVYPKWH